MEPVRRSGERVQIKPWLLAVAVAALFIGLSALWSFVSILVFAPQGLGSVLTLMGDVLRDSWGTYLTYVALAAAAAWLLWQERVSSSAVDMWSLLWRSAVVYLPVSLLVCLAISVGAALIHGGPLYFLGVEVFG